METWPPQPDIEGIARAFDARSESYAKNDWHRHCAGRLVELCDLRPGDRVLDAGTGTAFAAIAAALVVGPGGRVCAIDLSSGMLREAARAVDEHRIPNIELIQGDAMRLSRFGPGAFDVVTCAAGLLYMDVDSALREWRRVLVPGGIVGFSTMKAGSPAGGRIFRECAEAYGVNLADPSATLGSTDACRNALQDAGFDLELTVSETVPMSDQDRALAWESNLRSASHEAVLRLDTSTLEELHQAYLAKLDELDRAAPDTLRTADVIYAVGRRQSRRTDR